MLAQFPGSGEYGPFNEVKIPVGYRPVVDFFAPYSEVSGPNIFGTGRYGIGKDGGSRFMWRMPHGQNVTQRSRGLQMID